MESLQPRQKKELIIGALIGALLGAGAVWMLIFAPSDPEVDRDEPISANDILKLTSSAASLLNLLDWFRHRL